MYTVYILHIITVVYHKYYSIPYTNVHTLCILTVYVQKKLIFILINSSSGQHVVVQSAGGLGLGLHNYVDLLEGTAGRLAGVTRLPELPHTATAASVWVQRSGGCLCPALALAAACPAEAPGERRRRRRREGKGKGGQQLRCRELLTGSASGSSVSREQRAVTTTSLPSPASHSLCGRGCHHYSISDCVYSTF